MNMAKTKKKNTNSKSADLAKIKSKTRKSAYCKNRYSNEVLKEAINSVKSGTLSANKASREFKIPKGTLIKKLHEVNPCIKKRGPQSVLTEVEEDRLVKWIIDKAKIGFPMHPTVVKQAVKSVLDKAPRPNPFKNNLPGDKWFQLFLKRHPEISLKNTEILSKSRASVTEEQIREWFAGLKIYLEKEKVLDILDDPSRIFNLDETGVQLCPKTGKLLGSKKEKNMYCISPGQEKETITVLCCYSADGKGISPMIVYPYKRFPPKDIAASIPDGFVIGHSPNGWMTIDTYNQFIINGFHKELLKRGVKFPVLLLFDGHSSHISLALHEFCVEKGIFLYCFFPNATHIMQPCDVGIFRTLKIFWKKQVVLHSQNSVKPITKVNFAPLFNIAYKESCDPKIVKKAFECCGLYPFNPDRIDYTKCMSQRHKSIRNNLDSISERIDAESNSQSSSNTMLIDLERDIPNNILEEFNIAHEAGTSPPSEIILFNVWKKYKDNNDQIINITIETEPDDGNVLEKYDDIPIIDGDLLPLDHSSVDINSTNASNVSPTVIPGIFSIESSESNNEVLCPISLTNTESLVELQSNIISVNHSSDATLIPVNSSSEFNPININTADISSILTFQLPQTEIPISNNEVNLPGSVTTTESLNQQQLDVVVENNIAETAVISTCSPPGINPIVSEKNFSPPSLNDIWEQELHFPKIETTKKKVGKKKTIFAITSEDWRKEQEIKQKKDEELKRQKELRKFEREVKKKIKLEEDAEKKKLIQARKELRLKKQLEKEEKKTKITLLMKKKAESLGIENFSPNNVTKKNVPSPVRSDLNDITKLTPSPSVA